ncbi:MAG: HNH endonuclease signature motif containing protein [bacterium]|nr:HNH endonuclease signature motif containing protein [bacterium]
MFDYLLDYPEADPAQANPAVTADVRGSHAGMFMTRYQKERQDAYDRARHMVEGRGHLTPDVEDAKAEAALVREQAAVSRARGGQLGWVKSMLRRYSAARLGYGNPVDLVASRMDVHRSTARDLVYLAQRLDTSDIDRIRRGEVSYVRVLEETRLREAGASAEEIARTRDLDLNSVGRIVQQMRKITRDDERRIFEGQYVAFQPSLDGSHVRMNGRLGSFEAEICREALNRRGEALVPAGEERPDPGQRRALALTTLCQDELDKHPQVAPAAVPGTPSPRSRREPLLMVVANNPIAEASGFEQGVSVLAGGRVGPGTVDLIQCSGRIENITVTGQDINRHGSTSTIRPGLRRAVLARDDGCTIDGCSSTYRLDVHHILERSRGGDNSPENLTTLCWWHHHVAVHRRGMRIDPQSPPRRRRLLPERRACGYRPPPPDPYTLAALRALAKINRAPP